MAEVGRRRWRIAVVVHGGGFDLGVCGILDLEINELSPENLHFL